MLKVTTKMRNITNSNQIKFNYELFTAIIPAREYELEPELYAEILQSAFEWDTFFDSCKYKLSQMRDLINNPSFNTLIRLHAEVQVNPRRKHLPMLKPDGILPLLKDLIARKFHFIIPYVYITNCVPDEFKKVNLACFGVAETFPQLIDKARKDMETNPTKIKSIQDVLYVYDSKF
jgi:hypothetical protein